MKFASKMSWARTALIFGLALLLGGGIVFTQGEGPIKIGLFSPLTGPLAVPGTSALRGAQIAVDRINEAGGINGRQLELVNYDDSAKPDQAVSVAQKLVQQDKVIAAISGSISATTRAAASVFQSNNVPMISAYATHPSITEVGDLIFRIGIRSELHGYAGAVVAARELGADTVAILTIDNDYGTAVTQGFKDKLAELSAQYDVQVVYEKKYSFGETEFRSMLTSIKSLNPAVLYAVSYPADAAHIVSQAKEIGLRSQIIGQEAYDNFEFIDLAKGNSENGVILTTSWDHDSANPVVVDFVTEYKGRHGEEPDMRATGAFDSVQVLTNAIREEGTSAAEIKQALTVLQDFEEAVTGPLYRFTETRDIVRPIYVQIVRNSEFHYWMTLTEPDVITPPE